MRLKKLIKSILFPLYRRSNQIVGYIDNGYSHIRITLPWLMVALLVPLAVVVFTTKPAYG